MASERLQRRMDRLPHEAKEAVSELNWEVVLARAQASLTIAPD